LAEESGGDEWRDDGPPIWLIDPLDGTNNFAHGFPHVGVSLALVREQQPFVGVIYDPLRDETFAATVGGGAALNGDPIHVSDVDDLAKAFLATGFPYDRRTAPDNNVERLDHFLRRSQGVRRAGAAVLDLCYVACGRFDGFWEIRLHPWDVAAGVLIVREAGGRATDFSGGLGCLSGRRIQASNGRIHEQMLEVIHQGAAAPSPEPIEETQS
jgi:myo-inositol-1(or 4)-monophosphatase